MAYSCRAIAKNSFVTFVTEEVDDDQACPSSPARSRSLETVRKSSETEHLHEKTEQSLKRLTTVLNDNAWQPSPKTSAAATPVSSPGQAAIPNPTFKNGYGQKPPALPPGDFSLHHGHSSDQSFSTVAPDDTPEPRGALKAFGSSGSISSMASASGTQPRGSLKAFGSSGSLSSMVSWGNSGFRKVGSSNSISSMVSWADLAEDDDEVEFDLDIEAAALAACEESPVEDAEAVPEATTPIERRGKIVEEIRQRMSEEAPKRGKISEAMTHNRVPKNHNMTDMSESMKHEPPTTLMIRNIPGKYSQNHLMMDLHDTGFDDTYDFLYMPIDKGTSNSVGYAFVNFVDPALAAKCMDRFQGHRFTQLQRSSNKTARISVAHLQGLEKNLQHYQNTAVSAAKQQQRRPVVMLNRISEMVPPFSK